MGKRLKKMHFHLNQRVPKFCATLLDFQVLYLYKWEVRESWRNFIKCSRDGVGVGPLHEEAPALLLY